MQGLAVVAALVGTVGLRRLAPGAGRFRRRAARRAGAGQPRPALRNDRPSTRKPRERQSPSTSSSCPTWPPHYRPDLIVWPETSYPDDWVEEAARRRPDATRSRENAPRRMAARWQHATCWSASTPISSGRPADAPLQLGPADRARRAAGGRYDKIHRVPFGEYVPLRDWLPFMNGFAPYDFDYSIWPGETCTRFPLRGHGQVLTFGVLICYEDTDPSWRGAYGGGDGEPPVDFLVNISNDGWFDGTSEHDEHLAICRFRAVECRRSVARREHGHLGRDRRQRPRPPAARLPLPGASRDRRPCLDGADAERRRDRIAPVAVARIQESLRGAAGRHPPRPPRQPLCPLWRLAAVDVLDS